MRMRRVGSSLPALRSPRLLMRLGGGALVSVASLFCASGAQTAAATPAAARPGASAAQNLSLAVTLGGALRAGDTAMTVKFALTNTGPAVFDGCFGQSWGVSVIVGGHNAG